MNVAANVMVPVLLELLSPIPFSLSMTPECQWQIYLVHASLDWEK